VSASSTRRKAATLHKLNAGENTLYAAPVDLEEGYELIDPRPRHVTVSADGVPDVEEIVFEYRRVIPQVTPDAQEGFSMQPYEGYARAESDQINLRSSPDTRDSGNIVGKIRRTDLIELTGVTTVGNAKWYYVSVGGRVGYVSASVITQLTAEQVQLITGITPAPGQGMDAVADPETGLIERWGETNKARVRFRKSPNGDRLQEIRSKKTRLFVYDAEDVDGTLWYRAVLNGKEGYIMAEFVDLYSAQESQSLQFSLKTPVPTHTVAATRVPTSTPTAFIPTPTPTQAPVTPTPVVTQEPVRYTGYGLITARAPLRDGLSADASSVAVMVDGDTLVMVQGQTYVSGVCWDSVRIVSTGVTGFMEHKWITPVSVEDIEYYLQVAASPTPRPTPAETPLPFAGYARVWTDYVPMHQQADSHAAILTMLMRDGVVYVRAQETGSGGTIWCLAQSGSDLGYIRRDMLVQMSDDDVYTYLNTIRTRASATPAVTATPRAASAMATMHGYVVKDRVSLRSKPSSTNGNQLRLLSQNKYADVMGTIINEEGEIWYHVIVDGIFGYLRTDWVRVLTRGELDTFLNTDDFKGANPTESNVSGADSIQPYEDYLKNQSGLTEARQSYAPFDPYSTPMAILASTATPAPTATLPPTPVPTIISNLDRTGGTEKERTGGTEKDRSGGSSLGLLFIGLGIATAGGTALYALRLRRSSKRRRAVERAEAIRRRRPETVDRSARQRADDAEIVPGSARPAPAYREDAAGSSYDTEDDDVRVYRRPERTRTANGDDDMRVYRRGERTQTANGDDDVRVYRRPERAQTANGDDDMRVYRRPERTQTGSGEDDVHVYRRGERTERASGEDTGVYRPTAGQAVRTESVRSARGTVSADYGENGRDEITDWRPRRTQAAAQDDATLRFCRPQSGEKGAESPAGTQSPAAAPQDSGADTAPYVRRRRTERHHYDEDES